VGGGPAAIARDSIAAFCRKKEKARDFAERCPELLVIIALPGNAETQLKGVRMRMIKPATLALCLMLQPALAIGPAHAESALQAAEITVTGEGRVEARPDMAVISLGVTTEAKTAAGAMAGNSAQLGAVLATLKSAGIADRDLQTSGLSLNPNWNRRSETGPVIQGYIASNQLTARVRDLTILGAVLDAAITDGANTLNGVSFGLANDDDLRDEARKRAVADARHKAELLSKAAGVTLGAVVSISENGGGGGPAPLFRKSAAMMAEAVPVAEGEVSLSASVTLVWALQP